MKSATKPAVCCAEGGPEPALPIALADAQDPLTAASAMPVLLGLLSALVAIAVAVIGWKLAHHYRRRDRERADLTDMARLLHRIHVQIQVLTDQEGVVTVLDLLPLKELKAELECMATPLQPALRATKANITTCLNTYIATGLPAGDAAPGTLKQAQRQGRATHEALAAVKEAQAAVQRFRDL